MLKLLATTHNMFRELERKAKHFMAYFSSFLSFLLSSCLLLTFHGLAGALRASVTAVALETRLFLSLNRESSSYSDVFFL
jgi:hypothetical protein